MFGVNLGNSNPPPQQNPPLQQNPPPPPPPPPPETETETTLGFFNNGLNLITSTKDYFAIQPIKNYSPWSDNYQTQKDIAYHFYYKTLDNWLFKKDMNNIFRILKVNKTGHVELVANEAEIEKNDITKDSQEIFDKKVYFIEKNIFTIDSMKKIIRNMREFGYQLEDLESRWPRNVRYFISKYLKNKVREIVKHR
jgi:hypothetical protein